jgi:hypothetical protein
MNYTYTCKNKISGKITDGIITDMSPKRNVVKAIQCRMLNRKRDNRLAKLFFDYHGEMDDVESVKEFLPEQYKKYADNLGLLRRNLLSINYIVVKYKVSVEKGPQCLGCLYNECAQRSHMIEPHGCQI